MSTGSPLPGEPESIGSIFQANRPPLTYGEVHIWHTRIDKTRGRYPGTLSIDEIDRADKTVLRERRNAFVVARGFLREVLGLYLGIAPNEVEFVYGEFGKPALRNAPSGAPLYFNLSYSGEVALVGVNTVAEIGVDIEYMRDGISFDEIAKTFFSEVETEQLKQSPYLERKKKFYECWTMKEAFTKALGTGLTMALDSFEVGFTSDDDSSLSHYNGPEDISPAFTLKKLNLTPGYAGALAINGEITTLISIQPTG